MAIDAPEGRSIYIYRPNKIAPVIFAAAFALSGALHFGNASTRYKCFKIMFLHILCCVVFVAGVALREYNAFNYSFSKLNLDIHIASTCMIYMCPENKISPLLELADYHVLGRILYYVPYCSPLHPGRVLTTFGFLSGVVDAPNAIGISYIANPSVTEKRTRLGHILMKTSLVMQLLVIATFCMLAFSFQRKCTTAKMSGNRRVTAPLVTLYLSMFVIFARCIYRTVEHFGFSDKDGMSGKWIVSDVGTLSPIVRFEWFFYVFEAALMLINSVLWNVRHPGRYLPENYNTYLTRDGVRELVGPGWKDERPWIVTVCDPFGWFVKGEKGEKPFWETDGYAMEQQQQQQQQQEQTFYGSGHAYGRVHGHEFHEIGHAHGHGHDHSNSQDHGIGSDGMPLLLQVADPGAGGVAAV
ncbi:hypothetical protein AJ79_04872 [Helicocarpus griseus UAMH5409]|uniref:RTA1 domain-containing protein n=1 Tax=Helicocarpus griseus UAMH5409 TaxID=1447875 RepID=A0A2B7XSP0_9EURO|nr:hypothetical protein AJ79_04872 [Helicocarpus griseus UAMH5409]